MSARSLSHLDTAIILAAKAHSGQYDKAGNPYILHPIRIMSKLATDVERIVGVLHDVVEDTRYTFEDLQAEGFSDEVIAALKLLTHMDDTPYMDYIKRLAANPVARHVKMRDLEDNMDLARIPQPRPKDYDRLERYKEAYKYLEAYQPGVGVPN